MFRLSSGERPRSIRELATTFVLTFALGCEALPPASADARRCAAAVGLHLGLQRPVAVRSETAGGPQTLSVEFEGLNGENIPVQGHAECGFASGDEASRALTAVRIDGTPLSAAEVEALDKALASNRD